MTRLMTRLPALAVGLTAGLGVLGGCSSVGDLVGNGKIDYKSTTTRPTTRLEVPPDLVSPRGDDRYALPERSAAATTLSSYARERAARDQQLPSATAASRDVLSDVPGVRIERAGQMRWLVVDRPAAQLWPVLRAFWQENGFTIASDQPQIGVIETDWAENRAKIPQDMLRNLIGKVFDGLYSTGERDRFRVRVEPAGEGTEIYLSHRGMVEVLNASRDHAVWTQRPSDPELEAEFLRRLMVRLGTDAGRAATTVAQASTQAAPAAQARARSLPDGAVRVDESFDRAWRRVGLALDRAGFTVEDRDRANGTYFVRYVDPATDAQAGGQRGLLDRLFGGKAADPTPRRFRIVLARNAAADASAPAGATATDVRVLDRQGAPVADAAERPVAARIASLLLEQLK